MKRPKIPDLRIPQKYRDGKLLAQTAEELQSQMQAARETTDPAERLTKLLQVQSCAEEHVKTFCTETFSRTEGVALSLGMGSILSGGFGGALLAATVNPVLGVAVAAAGMVGFIGGITTGNGVNIIYKHFHEHLAKIESLIKDCIEETDKIIAESTPALLASPSTEALAKEYPELKDKLFFAFNRLAAERGFALSPDLGKALTTTTPVPQKVVTQPKGK